MAKYKPFAEQSFDPHEAFQLALERTYGRNSVTVATSKPKPAKKPSSKKKEFTPRERHMYHQSRADAARAGEAKAGVKYGDPRYCYSVGFTHGYWWNKDEEASIRNKFGERGARAYATGRARGKQALEEEKQQSFGGKKS